MEMPAVTGWHMQCLMCVLVMDRTTNPRLSSSSLCHSFVEPRTEAAPGGEPPAGVRAEKFEGFCPS